MLNTAAQWGTACLNSYLLLTGIVPRKPSGHFINISLTPHYNPIIQPMFTAIPVSLMWSDSLFFLIYLFYLAIHYIHDARWSSCSSVMKNLVPLRAHSKPSGLSVASFVVSLGFFPVSVHLFLAPAQGSAQLSHILYRVWPLAADSSRRPQRRRTHRRSRRSHQGRPRSRSPRRRATAWRCICFSSRRTGSTSTRSLQRGAENLQPRKCSRKITNHRRRTYSNIIISRFRHRKYI